MNNQPNKKPGRRRPDFIIILIAIAAIIGTWFLITSLTKPSSASIDVYQLETNITDVNDGISYKSITYIPAAGDNGDTIIITATLTSPVNGVDIHTITTSQGYWDSKLIYVINDFSAANPGSAIITGVDVRTSNGFWNILLNLLPLALSVLFFFFIFRNISGGNNKAMEFGKSRARLQREKTVTFKDVAGADEEKEEMAELIDFLKNPRKYVDMGARIPKGVLLVGSPGTGKTLLAKAVAGEANVPFFSISGSDFVELYVGIGASRVRDLFKVARENSPCIIFIDEIDAVGRQRGAGLGGGNDEREQTLNQLLVEMDGFSTHSGIIIIAATNRPDVLDPALLRPGRFDRQITIQMPDKKAREEILRVHARNKKLDSQVKLGDLAARIPGFSGADIENLLNEAALLAARDNRTLIILADLDEAVDRVMMGPAKKSRKYSPKEKEMVAYHEAGHAVIGIKVPDANVVQKITIIPRGQAGGYNLMMPNQETFLRTKKMLLAEITSFLGGRVAEELMFDTVTTGAYNDFQNATAIARSMVVEYGMSELGPIQYESNGGNVFLGRDYLKEKNFSDQVALEIDKEVRRIVLSCYDDAKKIISDNKDLLDTISHYLLKIETLNKSDIDEIVATGKLSWYKEDSDDQSKGDVPSAS